MSFDSLNSLYRFLTERQYPQNFMSGYAIANPTYIGYIKMCVVNPLTYN